MDLEQETESVQAHTDVENAELTHVGISVKFKPTVDTYLDGVKLLREVVTDETVEHYSNMTGEGDNQVIILVEYPNEYLPEP